MQRKILLAMISSACLLPAQTAQTTLFRAVMPSISAAGDSAVADIVVHYVEDSSNNILSGSVDFDIAYKFPNDEVVTGLGLVLNGSMVIATSISTASPLQATAGSGRINLQAQVPASQLAGLVANTAQYSVELITADSPSGAATGALQAANSVVLMTLLNSSAGTGAATVRVFYTGASYAITSAEVVMQVTYQFSGQVTFSSLRIYDQNGQIAVAADVEPGTLSASSGAGIFAAPSTEIDMNDSNMVAAVEGILGGPGSYSVQLGTVENPTAPLTGSLRGTDFMTFQVPAFPDSGTASEVRLHTLRNPAGSVIAATVIFDVNYRLAAGWTVAEMDIDTTIVAPGFTTDPSGSGNAYVLAGVYSGAGLTSVNGIVSDPEAHQIDVQVAAPPVTPLSQLISAALAPADTTPASVAAVIPIVEVKDLFTFAPGELVEIYGTNLAKVTVDLSGWPGVSLPASLNGVTVTIGGQTAPLLYVSEYQVDAAVAFETPTGTQTVTVNNGNGPSSVFTIDIAPIAPAIYNFAFENSNFSLVSSSNPAHVDDILVFYTTGMGQTTPVLTTGAVTPDGPPYFYTSPVTVTIGGVNANVVYSIAAPPYVAGLYQMAVTVPSGVGTGSVPVVAASGGLQSNTVMIQVQ